MLIVVRLWLLARECCRLVRIQFMCMATLVKYDMYIYVYICLLNVYIYTNLIHVHTYMYMYIYMYM